MSQKESTVAKVKTGKSWRERVIIRLKGGEEADLLKFNEGQIKYLEKQIEIREEAIKEAQEVLEEIQGDLNEYLESPSTNSIKTQENRKQYYPTFTKGALYFKTRMETQLDIIETNEEEISFFEDLIEVLR